MSTDDSVIKSIRRKVNGRTKSTRTPKASSWSLTAIEALAGKIDFDVLYERTDASTRRKLFTVAATQQLKDFVQQQRTSVRGRVALTEEELIAAIKGWTPTIKQRGKSLTEKASKFISAMNDEEKATLFKLLQEANDKLKQIDHKYSSHG